MYPKNRLKTQQVSGKNADERSRIFIMTSDVDAYLRGSHLCAPRACSLFTILSVSWLTCDARGERAGGWHDVAPLGILCYCYCCVCCV